MDHRLNTDNAWVESQAVNYHDEHSLVLHQLPFDSASGDGLSAQWLIADEDANVPEFHRELLEKVK